MSRISQIRCDAPNCGTLKLATNKWWIIREMGSEHYFSCQPMHNSEEEDGDQHFCSTPCMHAMLEQWMQSHMDQPAPAPGPRCTCKDTYEVGSGDRCPVHEMGKASDLDCPDCGYPRIPTIPNWCKRKHSRPEEKERRRLQEENNRREEERINRPA